jgi:hypothetical protein
MGYFGYVLIGIGILMFIGLLYKNYQDGKEDMLEKLFTDGKIDKDTYIKYKKDV